MDFNKAQREALAALETDVSVSAGAGSGKTRVLVERFCRLVREERAEPGEILTVTFTEKAAKQMKGRIVSRFRKWAADSGDERFEQAARDVEAAYIGTIHGFASRLLRENAFAAGVDPRFSQITEIQADILSERVLNILMAKHFAAGTREYVDLAFATGRNKVEHAVKFLAGQTASLGLDPEVIAVPSITAESLNDLAQTYVDIGTHIIGLPVEGTPALRRNLEEFIEFFPQIQTAMKATVADLADGGEAAYTSRFDWSRYELIGEAAKSFPRKVGKEDFQEPFGAPLRATAAAFHSAMLAPLGAHQTRCLARVTADWQEAYAEAKKTRGVLDFNDLLLKAHRLLVGPEGQITYTAERYRERFKYVMMDEFQDTNELQAALVRAVTPPERFFTVGDIKQSIYSFLHSDVTVFQAHNEKITAAGGRMITMGENYRSRSESIEFVNGLFRRLWEEDGDFPFEALRASGDFHPGEDRPVEFLWVEKPDAQGEQSDSEGGRQARTSPMEAARIQEAVAITGRIRQLLGLDGGEPMMVSRKDDKGGEPRHLTAGDIVILFAATTNIKIYEEELARAGLDYYVVSGRGFYASREVQDIVSLLRVVDNPLDDIAMVAVLRSPFVGLGEDALFWLSQSGVSNRRHGRLFTALEHIEEIEQLEPVDLSKAVAFSRTLAALREARSESRLVRFLERAVDLTAYDLKLLAGQGGKRRFANLRKLVDVARETSAAGIFEISEFIAHLERMRTVAQREGEAPTEAEESRVIQLMTVHKAKGLEAPVVFVADMSRGLRHDRSRSVFRFDKEIGAAAKVRNLATNDLEDTPASSKIMERAREREIGESKRLFYVAATRAEERLIFVGSPRFDGNFQNKPTFSKDNSWSDWIERAFDLTEPPDVDDLIVDDGPLRLRLLAGASLGPVPEGRGTSVGAVKVDRVELAAGRPLEIDVGPMPDIAAMEHVAQIGATGLVGLTVSGVTDYLDCPRKYRLKQLGVEEKSRAQFFAGGKDVGQSAGESAAPSDAAKLGTAVHDVLAAIDWRKDPVPQLRKLVTRQDKSLHYAAQDLGAQFLETGWPARFRGAERAMAEAPFSLELEGVHLYGRIDMLFQEDGRWVVVDYKTGSLDRGRGYEHQVRMYALAVAGALKEIPAEVALVAVGDGQDHVEPVDPGALEETEAFLIKTARGIRDGKFECKTDHCEQCGYHASFCASGAGAK